MSRDGVRSCGRCCVHILLQHPLSVSLVWRVSFECVDFLSFTPNINLIIPCQSKPSFARIYRVYIIGDFVFGPLFAAIGSFAQRFALMFASCCHAASGLY
jgi:hypothetical protein